MVSRRKKPPPMPTTLTTRMRKGYDQRIANIRFRDAIIQSQQRANLKAERDRLHGLLYHQVTPALHEKINTDLSQIKTLLSSL